MALAQRITLAPGGGRARITPGAPSAGYGASLLIRNTGAGEVEIGGRTVVPGEGFRVPVDATVGLDLGEGESLYACSADGSTLDVLGTR